MDYDAYIDLISEYLQVSSFNREELHIIESCFEKKWEASVAVSLIKSHWDSDDDYNNYGDFD